MRAFADFGWGLMAFGKLVDLTVTVWALSSYAWVVERNPIPLALWNAHGASGLIIAALIAIIMLTLVVELGSRIIERTAEPKKARVYRMLIYGMGYYAPGMFWVFVSVNNVMAIRDVIQFYGF